MEIQKNLTAANYSEGKTSRIKYLVIHYTGNNGDTARGNTQYFKTQNRGSSAHYFVDEKEIWQCVEDKNVAWHCGTKSGYYHPLCRNANSIGIELCSRISGGVYIIPEETKARGAALVRMLMEKYNILPDNVLRHYDVTHKLCPEPFVREEGQWIAFKKRLKEEINMEELRELQMQVQAYQARTNSIIDIMGEELAQLKKTVRAEQIYNYIDANMPEWAREAAGWMTEKGILQGTGDGLNLTETKLWMIVVLYRVCGWMAKLVGMKL